MAVHNIIYREDISKTNQGGPNSRRKKPKEVVYYANTTSPERCFIRLFKVYDALQIDLTMHCT